MNVIYFNKDCEIHAKEYAEEARAQEVANKISAGFEKFAIGLCFITATVATAILMALCFS